jgi:hypothetical protein
MHKTNRGIRAVIATAALGTVLVAGINPAGAGEREEPCYYDEYQNYICYTPTTRPPLNPGGRPTTTTTEATTTTAPRTTTTMGETTTTMGETTTTMGTTSTTMAPPVTGATGARPVAAQASYTG